MWTWRRHGKARKDVDTGRRADRGTGANYLVTMTLLTQAWK